MLGMPSDLKDEISLSVAVGKLAENSFDFVMRLFLAVACGLVYKKKLLPISSKTDVVLFQEPWTIWGGYFQRIKS